MIVRKGLLYAVLSHLCRSIDRHASITTLHHLKLDGDGNTFRIEATDLTTHVVATIPCDGRFSACLPARQLAEFVKPDDAADRHTQVELLPETDGKVEVAVEAALTTLPSLPAADFPRRPGDKLAPHDWKGAGTWRAADFASALGWVSLAVDNDETRKHLTGILFASDEVVGLAGHRLHLVRMNGIGGGTPTLIAGRSIAALLRLLPKSGDVAALRAKDTVRFTVTHFATQIGAPTIPRALLEPYESSSARPTRRRRPARRSKRLRR
jgi:DNA polymerase III sliding clamp (beta) subunit (PCNA family)